MAAINLDILARPVLWLASFSIDDGHIDNEHRGMLMLLNELCCTATHCPDSARQRLRAEDIVAILEDHIVSEERLFDDIGFPASLPHRREHDRIRQKFSAFVTHGDDALASSLLYTRTAMVEHLIRYDLGYKSYVHYHGGR